MITAVNLTAVLWYVNYDHIINIGRSSDTSRLGKRRLNQISCADKVIHTQYLLFFCCYHHFEVYFTDRVKCIIALEMILKRVKVKIITNLNTTSLGRILCIEIDAFLHILVKLNGPEHLLGNNISFRITSKINFLHQYTQV